MLERKIAEQGATEALLLTIDDGIDTRHLLMKRRTLYELLHPMMEEYFEQEGYKQFPACETEQEQSLLRTLVWAKFRESMPDSLNYWLALNQENGRCPRAFIEDSTSEKLVSQAEDALAQHKLSALLYGVYSEEEQEDEEWERS